MLAQLRLSNAFQLIVEVYGHVSAGVNREGGQMGSAETEGTPKGRARGDDVDQSCSQ